MSAVCPRNLFGGRSRRRCAITHHKHGFHQLSGPARRDALNALRLRIIPTAKFSERSLIATALRARNLQSRQ
jgi:hypothetical protein